MAIKWTIQGLFIYLTMGAYFLAFILYLVGAICNKLSKGVAGSYSTGSQAGSVLRAVGFGFYTVGFIAALIGCIYRWQDVQHIPLQNLFEVFLCLGMLIYPLSLFSRRFLGVGVESADALIGFAVLFPAGFVFNAEPRQLPPALQSWLFAPHVAAYMFAYVVMAKAAVQAGGQLFREGLADEHRITGYERGTYNLVRMGFPLLTLGLILGSVWGKIAWGDYWNWDPKELWSLISWLIYVGYLHFRYMIGLRYRVMNSIIAIVGFLAIIITLLWVNLSKIFGGLHSYAS